MKNILTISPHKKEFYSSEFIKSNNDKNGKNTAVKVGEKCDLDLAIFEHKNLVNSLLQLDINLINIDFPGLNIESLRKNEDYLDKSLGKYKKDNIVFSRDGFISNRKDKIILSKFRNSSRKFEDKIINEILKEVLDNNDIDREILTTVNFLEGGDFKYIENDNILFAGYNSDGKSSRNSIEGINYVKNEFNIKNQNFLVIESKGFHLDTVFSTITDKDGHLIGGIISSSDVNNLDEIEIFFKKRGLFLLNISSKYAINGNGFINTLSINDVLISSGTFTKKIEEFLEKKGIKRIITPTNQYWKVGGGVHCLTNEI